MASVVEKDAVEFTPFGEFICEITGACVVGVVVGSAYYFLKGIYYSPDGERFAGGTRAVRKNARRVAKGAALYYGLFNVCCRAMDYLKPKDVGIRNDMFAAAAVGGLTHMHEGFGQASKKALLFGGAIAMFDSALVMFIIPEGYFESRMPAACAAASAAVRYSTRDDQTFSVEYFGSDPELQ